MSKLLVIVGSTRPGRAADLVVPWVTSRARGHGGFDVEVADPRDWPLPIFAEHPGTIGDIADPTYSEPIVWAWNKKVKQADAGHARRPGPVVRGAGAGPRRAGRRSGLTINQGEIS